MDSKLGRLPLKWIVIFSIATNLLMIVPPLHMLQVYDRVLTSNSLETLIFISLIAVAAMVLFGIAEAVRGKLAQRAAARYTVSVSDQLFARLSHSTEGARESSAILRDFNQVRGFIASRTLVGLFDLPFAPLFILLMFMLHWSLGVVTVIGLMGLIFVAWLNKTATAQNSQAAQSSDQEALTFAQSVFMRSEDIRAMGLLPAVMERWGERMVTALQKGDESAGQSSVFYGISKSVRKILQIMIMGWGGYLVVQGEMSGGVIFAATMISGRALAPVEQVIGGWDRIISSYRAHQTIKNYLAGADTGESLVRLPDPTGHVSVEGLVYNPGQDPTSKPILDSVSFNVNAGDILAIIGPSGAGKSTLAKTIVGAINPEAGQIRLDGADRAQWPEDQWGEAVGYVSQEITLFPGSLAENIARLETQPNPEKVVAAAQAAGIHDMITGLADGYSTLIGPGQIPLSGGQKQRVALARALYSDPKVLVMDEPNAHLDANGEASLMAAMQRAKQAGRTIIVVTQRRSILQIADYVMTIQDGRVTDYSKMQSSSAGQKPTTVQSAQSSKADKATKGQRMRVAAPPLETPGSDRRPGPQQQKPVITGDDHDIGRAIKGEAK